MQHAGIGCIEDDLREDHSIRDQKIFRNKVSGDPQNDIDPAQNTNERFIGSAGEKDHINDKQDRYRQIQPFLSIIAPIEKILFNEAKSENKWVEASLVKVPTVASILYMIID